MATLLQMMYLTGILLSVASQPLATGDDMRHRSPKPLLNEQEWVHPVIFKPQNKIHLTGSSYKLTTFMDFAPFLNGFQRVREYLDIYIFIYIYIYIYI